MPFHEVVEEWDVGLTAGDPLAFAGYVAPAAGTGESVRTGRCEEYAFIESRFDVHGGTMGIAAGEKVVRAYRLYLAGSALGFWLLFAAAAQIMGWR